MEVPINRLGLGSPNQCRALIPHWIQGLDYAALDRYARSTIFIHNKSLYADDLDWSRDTRSHGYDGATIELEQLQTLRFDPEHDYIVLSGDSLRLILMTALIGRVYGKFCALRYDKHVSMYWPYCVDVRHLNVLPA